MDYYVYKAEAVSDLVGLRATRMASIAYLLFSLIPIFLAIRMRMSFSNANDSGGK